jgi:putative spermidine/putrescine transport system ATP-binding protein
LDISLENISLNIDGKQILDNIAFDVKDAEFVSLLGASGAGKSTILKVIAGITFQDTGQVLFSGNAVDNLPTHQRKTAIVFQDIRLFPNMNVLDNVAFPLKMQKVSKRERHEVAEQLLARVHLEGFGARQPSELSGGQQQRVALARALAARPQALLLDEPFSGLDENLRDGMRALVKELHAAYDCTTIMVTHDANEALVMSDRIVYLDAGQVVQIGSPADFVLSPANDSVRAAFGKASVIEGAVCDGVFECGALSLPAPDAPAGPAVFVRTSSGESFVKSL